MLNDDDGEELAKALKYNKSLGRLSLEGNLLGPDFLIGLAETMRFNNTIKHIDLEGNSLTNGNNEKGIEALFLSLRKNNTLMSLSLHNTSLTENCGNHIVNCLKVNRKIIMLDVEKNPNLSIEAVRSIQELLIRNYNETEEISTKEWMERKELIFEEDNTKKIRDYYEREVDIMNKIVDDAQAQQLKREELFLHKVSLL